jgi:hypothetical protein
MRGLKLIVTACLVLVLVPAGWWLAIRRNDRESPAPPIDSTPGRTDVAFSKLPETDPPEGFSITVWGKRDQFKIIREPWLVDARRGDTMLAYDEPVIGIALGEETRAYSTNQLNTHEMVVDEMAGIPILVTY